MSEKTSGTIIEADGTPAELPTIVLDDDDAMLLRNYKRFLLKYGLAEALRCKHCFEDLGPASAGMEARVTDTQIVFRCRHRLLYWQGGVTKLAS